MGLKPKRGEVISVEIENSLWEKNISGSGNPEGLLRATFYLIGLNVGMREGDEHRKLSITIFSFQNNTGSGEFLLYSEGVSQTNQGGLKQA